MESWVSWFQTNTGFGLTLTLIIFFITLVMAAKRWIGLFTTVVLMILSLGIGWALAHPDEVQEWLHTLSN